MISAYINPLDDSKIKAVSGELHLLFHDWVISIFLLPN